MGVGAAIGAALAAGAAEGSLADEAGAATAAAPGVGAVVVVAAVLLVVVLRRWTRQSQAATLSAPGSRLPAPDATPAELERLRQELDRLPR